MNLLPISPLNRRFSMTRTFTAAALIATFGLATTTANAALYEQSFDYGALVLDFGDDLSGDGWTDSTSLITYDPSGGLTYANHAGNTGGAWQMDHSSSVTRSANQNITDIDLSGTAGQVSYFFALGKATNSTNGGSVTFQSAGAVNDVTFTFSGGAISATFFGSGQSAVSSGTQSVADGETFAILVKATQSLSTSPTDSLMEVWLNPNLLSLGVADFSTASKFGRHGASQAMSSVDYTGTAGPDMYWDEVIWTTDFNDIAVPEPGSLALLGLGGLLVASRRRRNA